ncbi:Uncharacterised protein [Mycobacteroides abscessus subsp. bolletii]|nr:Uncharacterised protein [Mycobacteroides abscessus subsp. bolletii]SKG26661.1 Uncharacterised protein [Mycobacteroides abscessus subsp. bolletii]SKH28969.1 Uncharacterised protein [Mycobacteroides abscessus subsp. bolletii]SKH58318.1 Uncharacterised protein [Mycobacteroides abscessus subsp. bolletii]SKH89660.1 Uncharacterised protein [Mycobacteroides abscessus subsp. bolletii]
MTDAQRHGRAANVYGWISNGGASPDGGPVRECAYRLPGTPAYANVVYALNGAMLWGDGQSPTRECRHFSGIGKADRFASFLEGR